LESHQLVCDAVLQLVCDAVLKLVCDAVLTGAYEVTLFGWTAQLKRAMDAVHATVAIAGMNEDSELGPTATSASFRIRLLASPTKLLTTLRGSIHVHQVEANQSR
jgi:hypothetical protein